jgi:class 3 adenylate cyclase
LKTFLNDTSIKEELKNHDSEPIADLFPEATVVFADIAGFTIWSSTRDPSHVFILLETIYSHFDKIAQHRAVFKVETIGDSYVGACGLPEPNNNIPMARFADDCRKEMNKQTEALENRLGPGTNDLRLRFGLNSGPVTAGVIRGEKSRFQLFGDTVNTASRMESNGIKVKIHVSEATAQLIIAAGKSHWITAREDQIEAKGMKLMTPLLPRLSFPLSNRKIFVCDSR